MKNRSNRHSFYIWFDTEYSDLDLEKAFLLQVAVLVTDSALRRVLPPEDDVRLAIKLPEGRTVSPWVEENLPDLAKACRYPEAVELSQADARLASYVDKAVGLPQKQEDQRPVLAGNSIHADWWMIRRFLPRFLDRLHYRHLDVTAFKLEWRLIHPEEEFEKDKPELIKRFFPEAYLLDSACRHDAYYDLQASIAELAFYRQMFFSVSRP